MEDGAMKFNQIGILRSAEDEATESINRNKIKRSRKLTGRELEYKLEQLLIKNRKSMLSCSGCQLR